MTTVSLIGDSQAGGLRVPLEAALRRAGYEPLRFVYENGASTAKLISDHLASVLAPVPNILIVAAGGNDTVLSSAAWQQLVDTARRAGVQRVLWLGPPASTDSDRDQVRARVSQVQAEALRGRVWGWQDGRATTRDLPRAADPFFGVHLTPAGYVQWSDRIVRFMGSAKGMNVIMLAGAGILAGAAVAYLWTPSDVRQRAAKKGKQMYQKARKRFA